jgi:nicotinate-nucleotide adenylyltransferase
MSHPSTVETLRSLRQEVPDADLFCISGADAVADIEAWHEPAEVLRSARIIAVSRPGFAFHQFSAQLRPETLRRIDFIETIGIDLSATELRDRVRRGFPIRYLTPDGVVGYIAQHGLYREGGTSRATAEL